MDLHLRQYLSIDTNRLLVMVVDRALSSVDLDSLDTVITVNSIPLQDTLDSLVNGICIVGAFNGLVCIGTPFDEGLFEYKHYLINPFTGIFRIIPDSCTTRISGKYRVTCGFGYDDINHDYKLVRIMEDVVDDLYLDGVVIQSREVMTYSLNDNSWKLIEDVDEPSDNMYGDQHGVLVKNNLLHWVFWASNRYHIYCFDVRSDKWANEVPLMDLSTHQMTDVDEVNREKAVVSDLYLGVLNGCLCASGCTNLTGTVWVLKEYGVKESWVKLFEISQPNGYDFKVFGPFGFRRGSIHDVLIRTVDNDELHWCDIGSGTYGRTEEIKGLPEFEEACFLERSLVSFPGGQKIQAP